MKLQTAFRIAAIGLGAVALAWSQTANSLEPLTGVWEVSVVPGVPPGAPPPPPFLGLNMYGRDGSFTGVSGTAVPPIPPVQAVGNQIGPSLGHYRSIGESRFHLTFYAPILNDGNVNGWQKVTDTVVLAPSGATYSSETQSLVEFFDANWNLVFVTSGTARGRRLTSTDGH